MESRLFLIYMQDAAPFAEQLEACLACEGIDTTPIEVVPWTGNDVIPRAGSAGFLAIAATSAAPTYLCIIQSANLNNDAFLGLYRKYASVPSLEGNIYVLLIAWSSLPTALLDARILDFRGWLDPETKRPSKKYDEAVWRLIRFIRGSADEGDKRVAEYRRSRYYDSTPLPTLRPSALIPAREDLLLKLYSEVGSAWRLLTDVRFKLLALVPAVSAAALVAILPKDIVAAASGANPTSTATTWGVGRALVAIFGFVITGALAIYDRRNSELYDDLISRGRKVEEELGIDTGIFRGRRNPARRFQNHGTAVTLVYLMTMGGWLIALALIGIEMVGVSVIGELLYRLRTAITGAAG
jgi:hypothetical protein